MSSAVSDKVLHKPECTAKYYGWRLETSDLGSKGIVLSIKRKERPLSAAR